MEYQKYSVTIVVEPDGDGFYAHCLGLTGIFGYGGTQEEALQSARNGAIGIIQSKLRFGDPIEENCDLIKIVPENIRNKPQLTKYKEQITVPSMVPT